MRKGVPEEHIVEDKANRKLLCIPGQRRPHFTEGLGRTLVLRVRVRSFSRLRTMEPCCT